MKNIRYILILLLAVTSCDLTELPEDSATDEQVFNTVEGLELYSNSFYRALPSGDNIFQGDNMSDIVAVSSIRDFITPNGYDAQSSGGWSWSELRNINHYIEQTEKSTVDAEIKMNYLGIAKFFRAYFYFDKVVTYGDVPWYGKALSHEDEALFKGRDSRTLVMDSVLADLDYAIANITEDVDRSTSTITKSIALGFKSRVCLFEGTFRKYHTESGLQSSATAWLQNAVDAAETLMENGDYMIHSEDPGVSYRELFISPEPVSDEIMWAFVCSQNLSIYTAANRRFISPTYGARPCLTKDFVNTYLTLDGTPFTEITGFDTISFANEVKNRDMRLSQTIRLGDYHRTSNGIPEVAPPDFGVTFTGYQPIKWSYDEKMPYDDESLNDNAISMMRYAEILLNYAEAKAELGTITNEDWANTIVPIRERAGITASATLPTVADDYMMEMYPGVTDPVILEVRRERAIELIFEGFRFDDLIRWKAGELMNRDFNGIYVEALNTPMDLNEDGLFDVCFYMDEASLPDFTDAVYNQMRKIEIKDPSSTDVGTYLSEGTYGEVIWNAGAKSFEDKNYFYPIPQRDIDVNQNLLPQNTGW